MRYEVTAVVALALAALGPRSLAAQDVADSSSIAPEDSTPSGKGGLWGKAKKIAGNKVVQTVAKAAACTMVPGGQAIAGAIDAATGPSCMPGSNADMAAMMQQAMANAQAAQQGMAANGVELPGMAAGLGVPAMGAAGMGGPGGVTEAPGQMPILAANLAAELAKGKTAVRSIDWTADGARVSPRAQAAFDEAIATLAQVMAEVGGKYRLELYMDDRYNDLALKMYGPPRLQLVRSVLYAAQPGLDLQIGKAKRNNDARLEVVRK